MSVFIAVAILFGSTVYFASAQVALDADDNEILKSVKRTVSLLEAIVYALLAEEDALTGADVMTAAVTAGQGNVMIKRVGSDDFASSAPSGTVARVDGGVSSTLNPAAFSNILAGNHITYASDAAGFVEKAGVCTYAISTPQCAVTSFSITPSCDGLLCSAPVTVTNGDVTKTVFKYTPSSLSTGALSAPVQETQFPAATAATIPPPAPANLIASGISQFDIRLTWTVNSDESYAAGARVERAFSPGGPYEIVADIPALTYPLTTLSYTDRSYLFSAGVSYYYRVQEYNAIGPSAYSNVVSATVVSDTPPNTGAPAAPTNMTLSRVSLSEVDLLWSDNSANENGFIVEQSTLSPTSGFAPIDALGHDSTSYPVRSLNPNTTYYFRMKSFTDAAGKSTPSNVVTATTPAPVSIPDANNTWLFVITNRGTALQPAGVDFLCGSGSGSLIQTVNSWVKAEANKYLVAKPFNSIACAGQQVTIPSTLYPGPTVTLEGQTAQLPLNQDGVISYLQSDPSVPSAVRVAVSAAKFVTVFHYIPAQAAFINNAHGAKYSFLYFYPYPGAPGPAGAEFYPHFTMDQYGETLSHELMHNLGATDKYFVGFNQACLTDPSAGREYSGYDIMCHRVNDFYDEAQDSFQFPPYMRQIVSAPIAREIKWSAHPADVSGDYRIDISEITNYSSCWKTGCLWAGRENPVPIAYVTNGGALWRAGEAYHYVESAACPSCWAAGP